MKIKKLTNKLLTATFFFGYLLAGVGPSSTTGDGFDDLNLGEALTVGKTQGKAVVVKFHADWCHFCKKMDQETYSDEKVKKALKDFISIKVDVDTKAGLDYAREYGVSALPTILVFDPKGKKIYQQTGFHSSKQFQAVLKKVHG